MGITNSQIININNTPLPKDQMEEGLKETEYTEEIENIENNNNIQLKS